eukprot:scaffold197896_cov29-Tisochrysis_lutea.AAC.1
MLKILATMGSSRHQALLPDIERVQPQVWLFFRQVPPCGRYKFYLPAELWVARLVDGAWHLALPIATLVRMATWLRAIARVVPIPALVSLRALGRKVLFERRLELLELAQPHPRGARRLGLRERLSASPPLAFQLPAAADLRSPPAPSRRTPRSTFWPASGLGISSYTLRTSAS